jgi:hypothetical protein
MGLHTLTRESPSGGADAVVLMRWLGVVNTFKYVDLDRPENFGRL